MPDNDFDVTGPDGGPVDGPEESFGGELAPISVEVWRTRDFNAGRCLLEDIGQPKPPGAAQEPEMLLPLRERIREDTLHAYVELGGKDYLKSKPELLDKIILKSVTPDPAPVQSPGPPVDIYIEFPWLAGSDRLGYKRDGRISADILERSGITDAAAKERLPAPEMPEIEPTPKQPPATAPKGFPRAFDQITDAAPRKPLKSDPIPGPLDGWNPQDRPKPNQPD